MGHQWPKEVEGVTLENYTAVCGILRNRELVKRDEKNEEERILFLIFD